ncbi:2TM domain-containing protein [Flagellimonas myxillae]|uniref:2TM domain-containing protein n=1 Tax=Flagellimonas myxillae TaxID=2942214 RepID=UPI00201E94A8|nr:2TM domain-containing protein [Muricauda myxillae]MCL6265509.1 2TM domain-containing protein [Muricauda myxillae]
MIMEHLDQEKYNRAKKKIEEIKGFYIHLLIFVVINTFILVNIYLNSDNFWQWPHFVAFFGWGVGLLIHAGKTFGFILFFGKDWEERQIQKYIEKDKKEMDKYR